MSLSHNSVNTTKNLLVCLDAANPKSYSRNVHPYPTSLNEWATGGHQQTITEDSIKSPVGSRPLKIVTSGPSSYTSTYNSSSRNLAPAKVGETWTASFWVKGSSEITGNAIIFEANVSGNYHTVHNKTYDITTEWQRVDISAAFTNASTAYVQFRFDIYTSGVTVWYDGLQIEKGSLSAFNKTPNLNGTTWKNLVRGNYDAVFTGGTPTHNSDLGYMSLNGISEYFTHTNPGFSSGNGNDFSLEIMFKMRSLPTAQYGIDGHIWGGQNGNNIVMYLDAPSARPLIVYDDSRYAGTMRATTPVVQDQWVHWVCIGDGTANTVQHYINGQQDTTATLVSPSSQYVRAWPAVSYIGYDTRWGTYSSIDVAVCRMYSEKLTENEITNNFESLKGRFQ